MLAVVVDCDGKGGVDMRATRVTKYGRQDFVRVVCDIQKTIKIDSYTYEAIERCKGKNFSDKLRNLVTDYEIMKLTAEES